MAIQLTPRCGDGDETANRKLSPAVSDLIYRGFRGWGLAQVRLQRMASKPPAIEIQTLLAIAWSALTSQMRPQHVLVDETVAAAKNMQGQAVAGFVNALLRRTLADPLAAADAEHPIAKYNAPSWWIEKIIQDYPGSHEAVLNALTERSGLTVRLDSKVVVKPSAYCELLHEQGLQGIVVGPQAVSIRPPVPVSEIPGFSQGWVSVQDASAQEALHSIDAELLTAGPIEILDACAAPGGKTVALAQRFDGRVWAVDSSAARLAKLTTDLPRVAPTLKARVETVVHDLLRPWSSAKSASGAVLPQAFDLIVLDAPCSASGVTRRHPEIPWKRTPEQVKSVAQTQRQMLDLLWGRLQPGGQLLFVTCSIFSEEGEKQQEAFLNRTADAELLTSPGRLMPIAQIDKGIDQDGFFVARFRKRC
jgi:16S rRNA (cytosine967-C5)-methyltransferase